MAGQTLKGSIQDHIFRSDNVKHGNIGQAACGTGCSGNPFDASFPFSPLRHGVLHEIWHSLEQMVFKLEHGDGKFYGRHSVTNWAAFYVVDVYHSETVGEEAGWLDWEYWTVSSNDLRDALQKFYRDGDRPGTFSTNMDTFLAGRMAKNDAYAFYIQLMAIARHAGVVTNGYHLIPRLHIIERAWHAAYNDEAKWAAASSSIGMGALSRAQAKGLTNNEFIAITFSFAMGIDYTDIFNMWGVAGVAIGEKAQSQIELKRTERVFFEIDGNEHKLGALSKVRERLSA